MSEWDRVPDTLGEEVWRTTVGSGLDLWCNPRPGFARADAQLTFRAGSLDRQLRDGGSVPSGTAHFLEHLVFQHPDEGDLSVALAARGAAANAVTDWSSTTFDLGCSNGMAQHLRYLLERLFHPVFDRSAVDRERGIIEHELALADDDPGWRELELALSSMYPEHAVREDVVGDRESLRAIDAELLARFHDEFYAPANAVLVVVGGVDRDAIRAAVLSALPPAPSVRSSRERHAPGTPSADRARRLAFPVSRMRWLGCWRDPVNDDGEASTLRRRLVHRLLLDCLFSASAPLHQELYESAVIDDSFQASYTALPELGFTAIGADVDRPDELRDRLAQAFRDVRRNGLPPVTFERCKRRARASYVRTFDHLGSTTHALTELALADLLPHRWLELWSEIDIEELQAAADRNLLDEHQFEVVLEPTGTEGEA